MKGKIVKLNKWHKGNGSFVKIDETEYVILAPTNAQIGDEVNYEIANKFVYGKQVLSHLLPCAIEAYIDEDKPRSAPIPFRAHDAPKDSREEYWKAKEKRDIAQEPIITRRYCLSSAAQVFSGAQGQDEKIIALATKFEAFVNGKQ